MASLKISPELFLEAAELNRLKKFLDDEGFRKNIIQNTSSFGFIKSNNDSYFLNAKVEQDADIGGQKAVKIGAIAAVDSNGNFLSSPEISGIGIPLVNTWYWLRLKYAVSNIELGTFNLSANGDLVDTSGQAKLTEVLRGIGNFASRIKFANSVYNTQEYDVLEVIDNANAIIQHPTLNSSLLSSFEPENDLKLVVVGTFSPGVTIPTESKNIFNYDSVNVELIQESVPNTPPTFVLGKEFYVARVKVVDGNVIIQDKRNDIWHTNANFFSRQIDRNANPAVGIESIQYNNFYSPEDRNIVKVSWGFRTSNWTINSTENIVTFFSGTGGAFKSVNDFINGTFVGGRMYFPNGKYEKIIAAVKQGSAVNFKLDRLDVANVSGDGGQTFIGGQISAVPDCEEVELLFTPNPSDNKPAFTESFIFPVNELPGRCDVLVYDDPTVLYNVKYRYKSFKEYSEYFSIPSDAVGYLTEDSFNSNGNLKEEDQQVRFPFISDSLNGFVRFKNSPNSLRKFKEKVDKGDITGFEDISSFTNTIYEMIVGESKDYIYINGSPELSNDVFFNFRKDTAIEGNEFTVHIECTNILLGTSNIYFVQDYNTASQVVLKKIVQGDVYQMQNQEHGLVLNFKYSGSTWVCYQNYDLGTPFKIEMIDGVINDLFDGTTGLGKVRGLFGYVICNQIRTVNGVVVPNLKERFLVGANPDNSQYTVGQIGGANSVVLQKNQQGSFDIKAVSDRTAGAERNTGWKDWDFKPSTDSEWTRLPNGAGGNVNVGPITVKLGNAGESHENRPPYYAIIYAKKVY